MKIATWATGASVACTLFACALAVPAAATDEDFDAKARAAFAGPIAEYKIPGLVIGVTHHGQHRFFATGLASRADSRPATPDTLFELGSVSKIFNVTLTALAERRGKLSLGDTVAHHVCADACTIGDAMTLMDLATHHSGGLPLQVPNEVRTTDQLVDWLKRWRPPVPGARSYSNISIGLLGHITAKAMGTSYRRAFQDVLLPELGLTDTWIDVPAKAMDRYAFGYDRKTDKPIRAGAGVLDAEAYGVRSSARDMLKLLDVELGHGTPSPNLKAAIARTRQGQFQTSRFTQDMVWEQYPWPVDVETMAAGNSYDFILKPLPVTRIEPPLPPAKDVILNKTGSTNGFGAYVVLVPSEDLGIVVLANRSYPNEARVRATYALIRSLL